MKLAGLQLYEHAGKPRIFRAELLLVRQGEPKPNRPKHRIREQPCDRLGMITRPVPQVQHYPAGGPGPARRDRPSRTAWTCTATPTGPALTTPQRPAGGPVSGRRKIPRAGPPPHARPGG